MDISSQGVLAQYIGVNYRPDICSPVHLIASDSSQTTKYEFKTLSGVTQRLKNTENEGLTFESLYMKSVRIVVLTDASFGNFKDMKTQLGFFILMVDGSEKANQVHYGSSR